jgi:hypothetical protein
MSRTIPAIVVLTLGVGVWSAETVTAVSSAFSFPLSTATVATVQDAVYGSALECRAAATGRIALSWHAEQPFSRGTLVITALSGAVVRHYAVSAPAGPVKIESAGQFVAGVYLVKLSCGKMRKTITVLVP